MELEQEYDRVQEELEYFFRFPSIPRPVNVQVPVKRKMKFELQTDNLVIRSNTGKKLGRKFGFNNVRFLHRGKIGRPSKITKEGSPIELQSEAAKGHPKNTGFIEFETSDWHHDWCDVKKRIEEAKNMISAIMDPDLPNLAKPGARYKTVKFPFDTNHLKKKPEFEDGLSQKEILMVEIRDPTWKAKIQASESFELPYFKSYLVEHLGSRYAPDMIDKTNRILKRANVEEYSDLRLMRLFNFLLIIVQYLEAGKKSKPEKLAKEAIWLMCRTNMKSIYVKLLEPEEKKIFKRIVRGHYIENELKISPKNLVFKNGFLNMNGPRRRKRLRYKKLTVGNWLASFISPEWEKDLLSLIGGDNKAMGRYPVKTNPKSKERGLIKFEARGTIQGQSQPLSGWLTYIEKVFKNATNRGSNLKYVPKNC